MDDAVIWVRDEENKQPVLIRAGLRRADCKQKKGKRQSSNLCIFCCFLNVTAPNRNREQQLLTAAAGHGRESSGYPDPRESSCKLQSRCYYNAAPQPAQVTRLPGAHLAE